MAKRWKRRRKGQGAQPRRYRKVRKFQYTGTRLFELNENRAYGIAQLEEKIAAHLNRKVIAAAGKSMAALLEPERVEAFDPLAGLNLFNR